MSRRRSRRSSAKDCSSGTTIPVPTPRQPNCKNLDHFSSKTTKIAELIIGIIATAMFAIIRIILIILEFIKGFNGSYKGDESKNFQQSPFNVGQQTKNCMKKPNATE
jgi:hypothetical protein